MIKTSLLHTLPRPRRINSMLLITLLTAALGSGCSKPEVVSQHPDSYTLHNGKQGRFSDHRGQWLVINYWAIWCKPCIEEIPELNEFAALMDGTAALLTVDFDGTQPPELDASIKQLDIRVPVLLTDPSTVLGFPRPSALPATLIFTPTGELHKTLLGPQTSDSLRQALQ